MNRLQFNLLGQFLATALASVCRSQQVAPSLVGTVEDVRDLIAYHLASPGRSRRRRLRWPGAGDPKSSAA